MNKEKTGKILSILEREEIIEEIPCDCIDTCKRWGSTVDFSVNFYCPYVPKGLGFKDENEFCKMAVLNEPMFKSIIRK